MSRICVKGLPKNATEPQLKAHFASLGDITDVKIARTKAGVSRLFAFIGYKDEGAAAKAVSYFNRSFLGTSKLTVEQAREIGDDSVLQKAWSRHTQKKAEKKDKSSVDASKAGSGAVAAVAGAKSVKNAEQLAEFLSLAQPARSGSTWANDDSVNAKPPADIKGKRALASSSKAAKPVPGGDDNDDDGSSTDSEEYQDLGAVKKAGADSNDAEPNNGDDYDDMTGKSEQGKKGPKAAAAKGLSDMDFLRSHVVSSFSDDEDEGEAKDGSDDDKQLIDAEDGDDAMAGSRPAASGKRKRSASAASSDSAAAASNDGVPKKRKRANSASSADKPAAEAAAVDSTANGGFGVGTMADVSDTGRLFVRNLPFSATEAELREHFSRWGPLADVKLPLERGTTGKHRGFGLVTFIIPEHAVAALAASDGRPFQGRILHVLPAQPPRDTPATGSGDATAAAAGDGSGGGGGEGEGTGTKAGGSSFKRKQEEARRAGAGSEKEVGSVWHTLFVRADTSLAATAARLGLSKAELLGGDRGEGASSASASGSMAVRMALAEAGVVAETKEFLAREGVALGRLEAALQASVDAAEDAKKAMTSAAGGKKPAPSSAPVTITRSSTVILVKNLPYDADAEALRDMFSRYGHLLRFTLPPSRALALVEFTQPKAAKKAFSALAYARFQRQPLYLEWAPEGVFEQPAATTTSSAVVQAAAATTSAAAAAPAAAAGSDSKAAAPSTAAAPADPNAAADASSSSSSSSASAPSTDGRTLFVKNLSFSTTEEALREVFGRVAPLRSVKIPRRRNPRYKAPSSSEAVVVDAKKKGKKGAKAAAAAAGDDTTTEWLSMGYGFVEYLTSEGAAKALRMLQGVELDGHSLQLKVSVAPVAGAAGDAGASAAAASAQQKAKASAAASSSSSSSSKPIPAPPSASSTKVLVRNLAFEATKKDVAELAGAFGTVKSVRLPKKFDGSHRGFAFVEFLTHAEAVAAMSSLGSTHLYGRHLVCEWATAGDS